MLSDRTAVLADVDALIRDLMGGFGPAAEITLYTTFLGDLGMESLDLMALAARLQARYGDAVNLALSIATLDTSSIDELTVGLLVDFIATSLDKTPTSS
jgi:acyl carrier protein